MDDHAGCRTVGVAISSVKPQVNSAYSYVAYILGHVPITGLRDKFLSIQGDLKTSNEVVALWEENHKVSHSVDEFTRPLTPP
jgi:hypothetical protein